MPEQEGRALNLFCCDRRTPSESRVASSRDQIYRFIELEDRDGRRGGRGEPREGPFPSSALTPTVDLTWGGFIHSIRRVALRAEQIFHFPEFLLSRFSFSYKMKNPRPN